MVEKLRILISRLFALAMAAMLLVSSSALQEKLPLFGAFLFFVGIALVAVACIGRLWCSLYIAGYKTDTLIDQGPYSMCRNPLYFFSLLGAVGIGLTTETMLIPTIILIAFWAYYPLVIKSEERELLALHGDRFSAYRMRAPRFLPAISRLVEPEKYMVNPRVFRRHMADVIWFILIVGLLEIIKELHALNILPTLFNMY
jgi:protein-S-isoprenylcysteine O-methyltransferase Ste14